jgi:Outer membrane protein beta-barrel domain
MSPYRVWIVGTVLLLGVLSNTAFAQTWRDFELNIFGGGAWYSSKDFVIGFPQSVTFIPGEFKLNHAIRGGVRANVYTHGHWSEEFFYSYEPNKANFIRQTTPSTSLVLDLLVHNVGVNALYYFHDDETGRIRPFVSAGLGASIYQLTSEAKAVARDPLQGNPGNIDSSGEIAFNYGLGFKARMASWIGLRVDARGFVVPVPKFSLPGHSSDPNAAVFPAGGAMNVGEASAGLIFYFGKP